MNSLRDGMGYGHPGFEFSLHIEYYPTSEQNCWDNGSELAYSRCIMHVKALLPFYFNAETGEVVSLLVAWALGHRAG